MKKEILQVLTIALLLALAPTSICSCPKSTFPFGSVCSQCPPGCSECKGLHHCSSCNEGYVISKDSTEGQECKEITLITAAIPMYIIVISIVVIVLFFAGCIYGIIHEKKNPGAGYTSSTDSIHHFDNSPIPHKSPSRHRKSVHKNQAEKENNQGATVVPTFPEPPS